MHNVTVDSTSGYTYLSPPVIVVNRHNWGWGSCTKKRHSSVFEQEAIISELNHCFLVLWFFSSPPYMHKHTCFKCEGPIMVGHSSCIDSVPEVLWMGRALASEQRTRPCPSGDQMLELTGVTWVLRAEQPGCSKDPGGTAVLVSL